MKPEQERLRTVLSDTVSLLCKSGLQFSCELKVQGLLGVTVDDNEVFIVHINEAFSGSGGGGGVQPSTPGSTTSRPAASPAPSRGVSSSMAVIPYSSPSAQPHFDGGMNRTPQSAGRRLHGGLVGGMSSMSPAAKQAALKAKQKLQFTAGVARGGLSPRGVMKSPRGGMAGSPRGGGGPMGSPRGTLRGRGMMRGSPAAGRGRGSPFRSSDSITPLSSQGLPPNTKPAPNSHHSDMPRLKMMGGQMPGVEQPMGTPGHKGGQRADAPPPQKRMKTEMTDVNDIINLDDDANDQQYSSVVCNTGNSSTSMAPGMVQHSDITRVTITTNEQGLPVRQYERVQSATVPAHTQSTAAVSSTTSHGIKSETSNYTGDDFLQDIAHQDYTSYAPGYDTSTSGGDGYYYQSGTDLQDAGYGGDMMSDGVGGAWGGDSSTSANDWMGGGYQMKTDMSEHLSGFTGSTANQMPGVKIGRGGGEAGRGGGVPRGGMRGGRGAGGVVGRKPNAEAFSEVKGKGGVTEGDGTWKMVARFVCSIPGCEQSFSNKSNLLRHQNQKHGREAGGRGGGGDGYDDM